MRNQGGKVIGLKIESNRPEDEPRNIAIELADALQVEASARRDAMEFRGQAQRERQKAKQHSGLLITLTEYNRKKKKVVAAGEEWRVSRMEPMESYDEDIIREERILFINRAKELDELAHDCENRANEAQVKAGHLQKKLTRGR